ncbi:MAG: deoxynucleoside kinase [Oscillospiraceae bacterium]|nr:deoxynucleoside kinase [Oscillospiraceae bacterium]
MALIVIDGLDGSGKSTQLERVRSIIGDAEFISFPDYERASSALVKMYLNGDFSDTPDGVNAYAASSFYAVDRYASYKQVWEKAYLSDKLIIAARYVSSNALHQMGKLPEKEWDSYLEWLEDYEYDKLGLPRPDAVIFLDMPVEVSQKLLSSRYGGDEQKKDIHESNVDYLKKCRSTALYAAEKCGWQVISCADDSCDAPLAPSEITDKIMNVIRRVCADA